LPELLSAEFLVSLGAAGVRMATPLVLAALGEIVAERSGVMNLGLEGIMTVGAFAAYVGTLYSGSFSIGLLLAILAGACFGLLMSYMSITLRCNQVVSGLSIWLFGTGVVGFIFLGTFGAVTVPETIPTLSAIEIPLLSSIPIIGDIFFKHHILVYLSFVLVLVFWLFLFKTTYGLRITSVGENPHAADTLGINVFRIRYLCVVFGSMMAAIAGATLTFELGFFREYMVAGRGWMTIAIVIFGNWAPLRALGGALLFGLADGLQMRIGALGYFVMEYQILRTLPYLVTIAALILISRRAGGPAALGVPFERGQK
jgi:ABC-type uncharacterized transport system permease subunit